jgi:hypothetical protein
MSRVGSTDQSLVLCVACVEGSCCKGASFVRLSCLSLIVFADM